MLTAINVPGQYACSIPGLEPAATASCNVSWVVQQTDFDLWDAKYSMEATGLLKRSQIVTATTSASTTTDVEDYVSVQVALASLPKLTVRYTDIMATNRLQCNSMSIGSDLSVMVSNQCGDSMGSLGPYGMQQSQFPFMPGMHRGPCCKLCQDHNQKG
jgi:hypothetical protein